VDDFCKTGLRVRVGIPKATILMMNSNRHWQQHCLVDFGYDSKAKSFHNKHPCIKLEVKSSIYVSTESNWRDLDSGNHSGNHLNKQESKAFPATRTQGETVRIASMEVKLPQKNAHIDFLFTVQLI